MANPALTVDQNILPVQAYFNLDGSFNTFIGQGQPFYAKLNPIQFGLNITNSTIDSTAIGSTTPSTGAFTSLTTTTGQISTSPSNASDIANKLYVDTVAQGLGPKAACAVGTTVSITLSGLQTIDTYVTLAGDRVLVKNQGTSSQNGIYIASASTWTRARDMYVWSEVSGAYTVLLNGSQANTGWVCTASSTGTIGVTAMPWVQFSGNGSYFAGTGLTLSSNTFSLTNTTVTAASYGSASSVGTFTVNAQGQLTSAATTAIAIDSSQITSGTIASSLLSNSYTGITGVGTLTAGTWNASLISPTYGGTGASNLTGYLYANGASAATASTTIPNTSISGLGTMSTQNANNVSITGGSITGTPLSGSTVGGTTITASTQFSGPGIGLTGTATSLNIGGNASTVTNGVYTTGSYSNPAWITSILGSIVSGAVASATAATNVAGGSTGALPYQTGASVSTFLSLGTLGYVLTAGASAPTYVAQSTLSVGSASTATSATTATNLANGIASQIPYQTGAGVTSFVANGTTGQVLTSNGTSAPSWTTISASVTVTDDTSTNSTRYPLFASSTSGSLSTVYASSTKYQYNPSTGTLSATIFSGSGASLTSLNASQVSAGTLAVGNGGTGLTSLTAGYIPFGNGTGSLSSYSGLTYNATNNTLATPTLSITSITSVTPALSFNAANTSVASGASVAGNYLQSLFQNSSNTAGASVNYVLSNNLGTDSSYYGEFGMNSSTFSASTPGDFYSINNGIYFSGHDGDISVGSGNGYKTYLTYGTAGQSSHVINAAGAIGLSTNLGTTPATTGTTGYGTSGQVLTSSGSSAPPTWTTIGAGTSSYSRTSATATAAQTTFTVSYSAPYIAVYLNGVLLNAADYTATNGTTVVLTTAANAGDILDFIAYNTTTIGSPAGSNTQVQYNNGGALGASSSFTFTGTDLNIPFGTSGSATSSAKIALALAMIA
jgi:hypothetical protein